MLRTVLVCPVKQKNLYKSQYGVAVAEIIPVPHGKRSQVHDELKNIKILYDPTEPTGDEWEDV